MIDVLACESHFVDHLAPVWEALPPQQRGHFVVPPQLVSHARARGLAPGGDVHGAAPVVVASFGDTKRAHRAGRTRIARLEHGIGQTYRDTTSGSYPGGSGCDMVGLFLMPNRHAAQAWQATYPGAEVQVVGSPKIDALPAYEPADPPLVVVSFHWDCHLVPETRTAFYAFASAVRELSQVRNIACHAHPRFQRNVERWARRNQIAFIPDFAQVLRQAALFVCDNSSAMFEFAATGRPVVVLNAPAYRRNVDHGLRFWSAASVGLQVDEPAALADAVGRALLDPPAARLARTVALDEVYAYRDGQAAQRAAEALTAWSARALEVAA
jgi:hypothetical protein